jgi:hypothetical protein
MKNNISLTKKNTRNIDKKSKKCTVKPNQKIKEIIEPIKNKIHDKLFLDANSKIMSKDKNDNKEGENLYIYLYKNGYNKQNILNWLAMFTSNYDISMNIYNNQYNLINTESKLKLLYNIFFNKDKYNFKFTSNNFNYLLNQINEIYVYDDNIINKIDLYNYLYTCNMNSLKYFDLIKSFCNKYYIENKLNLENTNNIEKYNKSIGIYCLYDQSPAFKHSIEVINYLADYNNIILYIETTKENFNNDIYHKYVSHQNIKTEFIKDLSNESLIQLMNNYSHNILIFIYGLYCRGGVVLSHPAKYTLHYLDTPIFYTTQIFDYNLIDKYKYNLLNQIYMKNHKTSIKNENNFKFINLNVPYHMTPITNQCEFKNPEYKNERIQIGLISNSSVKICDKIILIINKLLHYNQNIYINIYTFTNQEWLLSNILKYKERIEIKLYDNLNFKYELQNNILFLDTSICNGHSTAMEILSSYRPYISYKNEDYYFGSISYNMIEHINMESELSANNLIDYIKLALYHLKSKENYDLLFKKFIKNLNESKIIDNKFYATDLYNQIKHLNE